MKIKISLLLLLSSFLVLPSAFPQGNLTPLGPPNPDPALNSSGQPIPNMKTLTQVEPRIPIDAKHAPGDSDSTFRISKAGSYYLTGEVTGAKGKSGIEIAASDVTIDLMGFRVVGVPESLSGIRTTVDDLRNIHVYGGSVTGWGGHGIDLIGDSTPAVANNVHLERLRVSLNSGIGVQCSACFVSDCVAAANKEGISISGGTVTNCVASENTSHGFNLFGASISGSTANDNKGTGIKAVNNTTVTNCLAFKNAADGIFTLRATIVGSTASANSGNGFAASDSTLTGCTATSNGTGTTGSGFSVGFGAVTIINCSANTNAKDGITVSSDSQVLNNLCYKNGIGTGVTNGAGIHATGAANRIEGNNTVNNDIGIKVDNAGNIIIKNSSRGGTDAYDIATGNSMGQEINVFDPNATTVINNSNPWANFLY